MQFNLSSGDKVLVVGFPKLVAPDGVVHWSTIPLGSPCISQDVRVVLIDPQFSQKSGVMNWIKGRANSCGIHGVHVVAPERLLSILEKKPAIPFSATAAPAPVQQLPSKPVPKKGLRAVGSNRRKNTLKGFVEELVGVDPHALDRAQAILKQAHANGFPLAEYQVVRDYIYQILRAKGLKRPARRRIRI